MPSPPGPPKAPAITASPKNTDEAIDDVEELDGDFVKLQKTRSQKRRAAKNISETRINKVLPFAFSPNIRPLCVSDIESVVALENAAFHDPQHRATREKFEYRLTTCPELGLGLFCTVVPDQLKGWDIETLPAAKRVETDRADGAVSVLLAHIVSTRCCGHVVADADMDYPKDWRSLGGKCTQVGHQEQGRTIALHSLAVSPKVQGCGIGQIIVKSYLQQMNNSGLADRVSLICQDYLVSYYERFGFTNKGPSDAQYGGGGWHNMVFELPGPSHTI
ncbi:Acyl-CoA N-acyltransferase [Coniochaeta hoffmannii]|uniref:Acyl-CoA N-acyltransferase n=1 Tax=Coniochaeta hoffmannii TaxID=91930 RepID=A0AA38S1J4_9PEZI|nr:Acyl-CoA N-acyltransferase [Coniochaeta hoffmannii]